MFPKVYNYHYRIRPKPPADIQWKTALYILTCLLRGKFMSGSAACAGKDPRSKP